MLSLGAGWGSNRAAGTRGKVQEISLRFSQIGKGTTKGSPSTQSWHLSAVGRGRRGPASQHA